MTKTLQRFLLLTVLMTAACGSSATTTPDAAGGTGGGAGAAGSDGGGGSAGAAGSDGGTDVALTADVGSSAQDTAAAEGGADTAATAATNIKAATGGTVTAAGLTVVIPAGALAADTDITVAISDGASLPAAATLLGKVYDLGPTGTTFLKPVTLTLDFDPAKLVAPKVATVAFLQAGAWVALADSSTSGAKASATTTHFTPFAVVSTDPVVSNCAGMAKAACKSCCDTTFASGKGKVIPSILQTCACAATAPCNAQCAANVCAGMAITPECKTCFDAETSKSQSACFDQGLIACAAMADCKAYTTCSTSCQ
jgi:trimeric autotransporter adhesin